MNPVIDSYHRSPFDPNSSNSSYPNWYANRHSSHPTPKHQYNFFFPSNRHISNCLYSLQQFHLTGLQIHDSTGRSSRKSKVNPNCALLFYNSTGNESGYSIKRSKLSSSSSSTPINCITDPCTNPQNIVISFTSSGYPHDDKI